MAYCDIQGSFLGNKIDKIFFPQNRNRIANIVTDQKFKNWFQNGRKDKDGNPVLDETLSFTNEGGQKKTIFDFGINFENPGEVYRVLTNAHSPSSGIYLYKGELFINNTKVNSEGEYSAKNAMRLINTVQYYYPDLLTIQIYDRKGGLTYSKDKSIPLPIVKVDETVPLTNTPTMFSVHGTPLVNEDNDRFNQLRTVDTLSSLQDTMNEFRMYGLSPRDLVKISMTPEISDETYAGLLSLLQKINPEFKVKVLSGLPAAGISYIKDFTIQLEEGSQLKAMSEEVAHFFFELLPKDNPLRKDMMENITSFAIYPLTLNSYKNLPEYQIDGKPNYDKIKREASAKLIAEYVYALSTGDKSRVQLLTKTKEGFIQKWWSRFLKFIGKSKKEVFDDRVKSFMETADRLLNENIEWLSMEGLTDNGDVFYSESESNKVTIATTIIGDVIKAGKVEQLQGVIDKFRKDLAKNYIKIVKQDTQDALNKELMKGEGSDINYLGELFDIVKKVKIVDKDISGNPEDGIHTAMSADNQIINLSEFLTVVANMQKLAKAISVVSSKYTASGEYMNNISQIQSFRESYANFKSLINSDLMNILGDSGTGLDVLTELRNMTTVFDATEVQVIDKLRGNYAVWMKKTMDPQNDKIISTYMTGVNRILPKYIKDAELRSEVDDALKQYINDLKGDKTTFEARKALLEKFNEINTKRGKLNKSQIPKELMKSRDMTELFDKVGRLYTTNQAIIDLLSGSGRDIDLRSSLSHIVTAGIKNYDMHVANLANYILDKRANAQQAASSQIRNFQAKVDPIIKEFKKAGFGDEYTMGEGITYIDEIEDTSTDPKTGKLNYPDGRRKIVRLLGPTMEEINIINTKLEKEKNSTRRKWKNSKPGTEIQKELRKQFVKARKDYFDFNSKYYNSPFTKELTDFENKWNQNEEFLDIMEEWNLLTTEERGILDFLEQNRDITPDYRRLTEIQQRKNALLSEKNKTEGELNKTKLLKQYFEESKKFRVEDTRRTERNYLLARNTYESKVNFAISKFLQNTPKDLRSIDNLEDSLIQNMRDTTLRVKDIYKLEAIGNEDISKDMMVTTDEEIQLVKDILLREWAARNGVKVRNEKYYEEQKKRLEEIEQLKTLKGLSKVDDYISDLYKQMSDLLIARKDTYGQKNPDILSEKERAQIEKLEDNISAIKELSLHSSGGRIRTYKISDEVKNDPSKAKYSDAIQNYEDWVDEFYNMVTGAKSIDNIDNVRNQIYEYNKLLAQIGVIQEKQIDASGRIGELWGELASLTDRIPTQAYIDRMQDLIPILEDLLEIAQNTRSDVTKLSKTQILALDKEIANLKFLIGGESGVGGLLEAIHGGNYNLLDQILNDEYFITYIDPVTKNEVKIPVEFKKYVEINDDEFGIDENQAIRNDFFEWFESAHTHGILYLNETDPSAPGEILKGNRRINADYVRRMFYTYSEPSEDRPDLFDVKPAKRYYATKINNDPKTGFFQKQVSWKDSDDPEDWTVDNQEGRPKYLPLSRKQRLVKGDKSTQYLNQDYYNLKDNTDKKSKLLKSYLDVSLKTYLKEQESKPDNVKSWYNLPVTNLDSWQSDKAYISNLPDRAKRVLQGIKGFFTRSQETDAEDQLTGIDQIRDIDNFTQNVITAKIPRLGMNVKLPAERVNRNVLHAMEMYMYNSRDFDARSDLNPFVKGLLDVMKANQNSERFTQKKRTEIFNDIYEQFILEELPDNKSNLRVFRKAANTLMRFTGFKITADVVGGAVNYIQANVNNTIEAFAFKHTSPRSYGVGYRRAFDMIGQMTLDFNKKSDYHFWTLMYQTFDFIQGEVMEDLMERSSVKNKLFDWKSHLMIPRKKGELHAQSAMAISILDQNKATNSLDGKKYPLWQIYEKNGNDLALKEGFDPELYNPVTGTEFWRVKKLIWSVNNSLHGNYAKFTQTEASRHSIGKIAENMKRWFVPGFQRRFGREYFDVNYQDLDEGFYNTAGSFLFKTMFELIKLNWGGAKGQWDFYMNTPRKRENLARAATEVIASAILFMISSFAFGYDSDDKDKNKKLKQNSWLYNELLLITLRTYAEQTAYIPVPPFGFTEMTRNLLDPFSIGKSSFTNAIATLVSGLYTTSYYLGFNSLLGVTEKDVFYQKDAGGRFMKKGDLKVLQYLFKTFGYTGSQLDPVYYLKNYQALQNRLK